MALFCKMAASIDSIPRLVLDKIADNVLKSQELVMVAIEHRHPSSPGYRIGKAFLTVRRNMAAPKWHMTVVGRSGRPVFVRSKAAFDKVLADAFRYPLMTELHYYQGPGAGGNPILETGRYRIPDSEEWELCEDERDPDCVFYRKFGKWDMPGFDDGVVLANADAEEERQLKLHDDARDWIHKQIVEHVRDMVAEF